MSAATRTPSFRCHSACQRCSCGAAPGVPMPGDVNTVMTFGFTLKGIIEGDSDPETFLPELIELHRQGKLPFDRMITTFPFAKINEAIAAQHHGECIKVVLLMDA